MTGVDIALKHRGSYHDAESAYNRYGPVFNAVSQCAAESGLQVVERAQIGDLVVISPAPRIYPGDIAGICLGAEVVTMSHKGVIGISASKIIKAWEVPKQCPQ